jgi:hypothetical protein
MFKLRSMPCDDSICRDHLAKTLSKGIKLNSTNVNEFKTNKTLRKLIESQSYLIEEESSLKNELEV